mmetsp:Transcript_2225/g.6636  ORF Transcript_2225/g.6636 Transcript_2225/m.6636 type:complete len:84 (-) Transcript_2225:464-715(-)
MVRFLSERPTVLCAYSAHNFRFTEMARSVLPELKAGLEQVDPGDQIEQCSRDTARWTNFTRDRWPKLDEKMFGRGCPHEKTHF